MTYRSVYIHVPFCRHRCGYCDFTLVAGRDDLVGAYLDALAIEFQRVGKEVEREELRVEREDETASVNKSLNSQPSTLNSQIDTLFFGGGTPTHLSPEQLATLFRLVRERFRLAEGYEWSVEANPVNLSNEIVAVLAEQGVNRVSLGAQSFDQNALKVLERDHTPAEINAAVDRLRSAGIENVSIDLIFGVPGQSLDSWRDTLRQAIELATPHVSAYGLTFEKGTAFWSRRDKGQLRQADEELERAMYASAMEELPAAGLHQYELSNYARPGFECRHNAMYWARRPFEAFGPGAARLTDGVRKTNHRSVFTWIKRLTAGESPVADVDELTPEEIARETIFVGLRRTAGIEREAFRQSTGIALDELAGDALGRQIELGFLEDTGAHIRLTREGRFVADSVIAEFL